MGEREFHYQWSWTLDASPEELWPYVADTNRLDRDLGFPPVAAVSSQDEDGERLARYRTERMEMVWEEEPYQWIYPRRYGIRRRYRCGPVSEILVEARLQPRPDGGTDFAYDFGVVSSHWLAPVWAPLLVRGVLARRLDRVVRRYDEMAQAETPLPEAADTRPRLAPGAPGRLAQIRRELVNGEGWDEALVDRLLRLAREGDALSLARLRPYQLADLWEAPRRTVLELFLQATRAGLLDFQWEFICPHCRNAGDNVYDHLREVASEVAYCRTCRVDYSVDFARSVELTFRVNPAIREAPPTEFCLSSPQMAPHIVARQKLPPRSRQTLAPVLAEGRYRLWSPGLNGRPPLRVAAEGAPELTIQPHPESWAAEEEVVLAPQPRIHVENAGDEELMLILERIAWSDQAATAAEVTTLQRFRDLFSQEALRPEVQISVGKLTVAFTDLRESTRMYREIGDAPAFGVVMDHFDVLNQAIDREGGAVVKTIGDAVMAAFPRPIAALRAVLEAQRRLMHPPGEQRPLWLKAAVHTGPAIAVNLNERLDYFGSTVNLAARLEKFSRGGDMIFSQAVYDDPEVQEYLGDAAPEFEVLSFAEMVRGFDKTQFRLWCVRPRDWRPPASGRPES
jgi:class 3 adenylate cyclase